MQQAVTGRSPAALGETRDIVKAPKLQSCLIIYRVYGVLSA